MTTNFSTEEMTAIADILSQAQTNGFLKIGYDDEQGVFTQGTINDMVVKVAGLADHASLKQDVATLSNDLQAMGQIVAAPPVFTADEKAQMTILDGATKHPDVVALVKAAQYVGFWSDGQLNVLLSKEGELSAGGQAAVNQLNTDLTAGNQILPDAPIAEIVAIVGSHHPHSHDLHLV